MKLTEMRCDICLDKIGLYQPWYSILVKKNLVLQRKAKLSNMKNNPLCLCPNCFNAYQDFLIEREVQENHKRNYNDLVNNYSKSRNNERGE